MRRISAELREVYRYPEERRALVPVDSFLSNFTVEVTNRAWIGVAVAPFAQRKFSIFHDPRTHEEQSQFEISLFEARLPLLRPFAVSLKDELRIERQQGRATRFFFIPGTVWRQRPRIIAHAEWPRNGTELARLQRILQNWLLISEGSKLNP